MKPSIDMIWQWLEQIPDPEIPAISVVDLGIIRHLAWLGDALELHITPTYSGCPATAVIALDIETALQKRGIDAVQIKTRLAPPWTSDWLSDKARAKLEHDGIAPPEYAGKPKHCPRCQSQQVERISPYGSTPCKAQWRCKTCLEPFDYFKCI